MIKFLFLITLVIIIAFVTVQLISAITHPATSPQKLFKDFDAVPDDDARYTLTIFSDLAVKNDASRIFAWAYGYPGHCFLRLTKISGLHCATKSFGLYPRIPLWCLLSGRSVEGKLSDDAMHEYDMHQTTELTKEHFENTINTIKTRMKNLRYNLREYNCADFALEIYNIHYPCNPLVLDKTAMLNKIFAMSTPKGLYHLLQDQQNIKP